jgi:DNA/RNA endonuclease YhcR with UshA esterase domain
LSDGSGEVQVVLWDAVYERVQGREELVEGGWVRVTGAVEVYRDTLEVVPALPGDVEVEE